MRFLFAIPLQSVATGSEETSLMFFLFAFIIGGVAIYAFFDAAKDKKEREVTRNRRFHTERSEKNEEDSFKVAEDGTIIRISGVTTCSVCHATIPPNAKYCPECGAKLK